MPDMLKSREDHKLGLAAEMLRLPRHPSTQGLGTSMLPSVWPAICSRFKPQRSTKSFLEDIVLVRRDNRFFLIGWLKGAGRGLLFVDHKR